MLHTHHHIHKAHSIENIKHQYDKKTFHYALLSDKLYILKTEYNHNANFVITDGKAGCYSENPRQS